MLIFAILFIIIGGWFAGCEISLAKVSKIRMLSYADDGDKRAKTVLKLIEKFDKTLTTLLIGNNIMHIGSASLVTLYVEDKFGDKYVTLATFITTFVVFYFSEMIPKAFAKTCSEKFSLFSSGPLYILVKILTPISFIFTKLTSLIEKPLGIEEEEEAPTLTQEELQDIIENIDDDDKIDEDTKDLVQNVIAFTEKTAGDCLTDWNKIITIRQGMSKNEILAIHREYQYSRYPIVNSFGKPSGMLNIEDYLKACAQKNRPVLASIMSKISYVEATEKLSDLLKKMSSAKVSFALVKDSGGNIIGGISVEDILEEIVGEIYDETDSEEASI